MGNKKIMVVDDLHSTCILIADVVKYSPLGDGSCSLTLCHDAAAAIDRIVNDEVPYDLVITDLQLDSKSPSNHGGIEVAVAAKNRPLSETKVIIMTGARNVDLDGIGGGCNADVYIEKPFFNDEVLRAINNCLGMLPQTA